MRNAELGTQKVRRLYGELEGTDRFALVLAALARGDVAEAEHIAASTGPVWKDPQATAFLGVSRAAQGLGWSFGIRAAARIGWLDGFDLMQQRLEMAFAPDLGTSSLLRTVGRARAGAAAALASLLQALAEACEDVRGLDPWIFIAAMSSPIPDGLERHRELLAGTQPDPEELEAARALFAEVLAAAQIEG